MAQLTNSRFEKIRTKCLSAGVLYEDPEFPAVPKSIYFSRTDHNIQWHRPAVCVELTACALLCACDNQIL